MPYTNPPSYETATTYQSQPMVDQQHQENPPLYDYLANADPPTPIQDAYIVRVRKDDEKYQNMPGTYQPLPMVDQPYQENPPMHGNQAYADSPPPQDAYLVRVEGGEHDEDYVGIISFENKSVRLGFIRKVFAILTLQMTVTIGMTCFFLFHEPTKEYVQKRLGLYYAAYAIFLILYIVLACCTNVARIHPINLILLTLFTLSLGYMVAAISSRYDTKIVLAAFGMTMFCSIAVIAFASQTKFDITLCSSALFIFCISLFFFGLFAAILVPTGAMRIVNIVYATLGAILFMGFLAFDTQLIMGGRKYELDPEDYIFAAMMLYVDVIYIFLFILRLFRS